MDKVGTTLDEVLKEGWKHGPLGCCGNCACDTNSVPCKTAMVGCCFPCVQFGMTEHALGQNFIAGCCYSACCTHVSAFTQRRHIKKGNLVLDCGLACFCPHCVVMQNANEVGENACYTHWTIAELMKPPTVQDLKNEVKTAVKDGTDGL